MTAASKRRTVTVPKCRRKLSVGADGNLTGYAPLREPRECSLTLGGDWKVTDTREMLHP